MVPHRSHVLLNGVWVHEGVLPHVCEEFPRPLRVPDQQNAAVDACTDETTHVFITFLSAELE